MKNRSRAGGEPTKGRRPKTPEPERGNAPKGQARSKLSPATEETEVARLNRELSEEQKQRTATSEILHLLSGSPGDLNLLFDAILTNATKLCQANFGSLFLCEADAFRIVGQHNAPDAFAELRRREPLVRGRPISRVAETKQVVQIADVREYVASNQADKDAIAFAKVSGVRTLLMVPMLKDGEVVGAIVIYRQVVRTFNEREIALLKSFAAQAVIAIENARLLNELRQSLEQQTATSAVLQVISRYLGELDPVFRAILGNATRICEAKFGNLYLYSGAAFRLVASDSPSVEVASERLADPLIQPARGTGLGRMIAAMAAVQIADVLNDPDYPRDHPLRALGERQGIRTLLCVPMIKEEELVGAIVIFRQEVRPFTDKQIELIKNFAAQAVIAIENARLLNELRQRTTDLSEALEQQTASSEVLTVISSSPGELERVFQSILEKATRICEANFGTLFRFDGKDLRPVAQVGTPSELIEAQRRPSQATPGGLLDQVAQTKRVIHTADRAADAVPGLAAKFGGARSVVGVPMLKDDALIGAIIIYRQEVRPFTDKQIELVKNFAAQAVIAIENARLLNELRQRTDDLGQRTADLTEALERQTATSEVLKVISSSLGDLGPVFATMLESATRLCDASFGSMQVREGDGFRRVAMYNASAELLDFHRDAPVISIANAKSLADTVETKAVVQVPDLQIDDPETPLAKYAGARTLVVVPLLKEDDVIGAFGLFRREVRAFSDNQIALVVNFAAQAVVAIENARLLNELRQSLVHQTATAQVLQVISSSPGELEPVFRAILENSTRICEAEYGVLFRYDGDVLKFAAEVGTPKELREFQKIRGPFRPTPGSRMERLILTKQVVDALDDASDDVPSPAAELGGARSVVDVPMLKDDEVVGVIAIFRREVRPFTHEQVALVQNFANQAVIAIENARLLNELRQSLEQQTATADVLKVISRSTFDLQKVLDTLVERAAELCRAERASITVPKGQRYHRVASYGFSSEWREYLDNNPIAVDRGNIVGRVVLEGRTIQVEDIEADPEWTFTAGTWLAKVRTILGVPLMREDSPMGVLVLTRANVEAFTDRQIELVQTFADQAVIAIENARLLSELRERTDQLDAQSRQLATLNQQLEQRVTDQVDEIERMSRLRRFLPPQVADLIVASGSEKQLESHRREITALFCDLRGFTGFTESADAEDVMALLRDYHAAIGEIIIKYNGTLERYAGDGVMVVFNDPVPVENPALQAVLMALELRRAIGALTETWSRLGHEIGFGIGIAHGFATLGTIGFEGRFDYAAIGTVSNVASRLCDEAKPGQILISPRVLMKVENAVKVEPVGEFELKGIRRPLAAYNVLD